MDHESTGDGVLDCVVTPEDAPAVLRRRLCLSADEEVRIAYVPGPGDVVGTFGHWLEGRHDPRVPVIAYSTMFYTLVEKLDAKALVVTQVDSTPETEHPRFRFAHVPRNQRSGPIGYRVGKVVQAVHLARTLSAYRPHVVVVSTDAPALLLRLLSRRVRIVLSMHNTFWPRGRRRHDALTRIGHRLIAAGLNRVAGAVCVSEEGRAQFLMLHPHARNVLVSTMQIVGRDLKPIRRAEAVRTLLYLGRIEVNKGVFDLITAFERVSEAFPESWLELAGSGSAESALAERIGKSSARTRIRVLGLLDAEDVHSALDRADLLICPTRSTFPEGFAKVVAEAAIHGVPSIVSSTIPAADLFPEAHVEFPCDDADALAARLTEIMGDPPAFRELRCRVAAGRDQFLDRGRSWGSTLCQTLLF